MANPGSTHSRNRALWLIAFALCVIAMCLVLLVDRKLTREKVEAANNAAPPPVIAQSAHTPHFLRRSSPVTHAKHTEPAVSEPTPVAAVAPPQAEPIPQTVAAVASSPEVLTSPGIAAIAVTNGLGTITGRITLTGNPPPEKTIVRGALCGNIRTGTISTRHYEVSPDGGLANVFVYIKSGLRPQKFPTPEPAVLRITNCQFEPYVLGMMSLQALVVTNSDHTIHDADARTSKGVTIFNRMERPGVFFSQRMIAPMIPIRVRCDVHPWMSAYLCVVDNPFFAVTDKSGSFTITNVPPGEYELAAYHVHTHSILSKHFVQTITVKPDAVTDASFDFEAVDPVVAKR